MRTRWSKGFKDLRQNKVRSFLVVLAMSMGLAGFGSLLSTYSILTRELNSGYLASSPASATLWMGAVNDDLVAFVKHFPGIGKVEQRRAISARLRVGPNEWRNALIFIIKDFQNIQVSKLEPQKGKWPPADGEILIERDALGVAHVSIGDSVVVKTPEGREQSLPVSGSVHDVGQAQARMEQIVYGYITLNTLNQLGESPYFDELKIIVADAKSDEARIHHQIDELKKSLESKGYPVHRVEIPTPGKHPHADLMGAMLLFQSSFGLFALLLSAVLVMNLFSSVMAGQIRQIGIMKAIGARRIQVVEIYFSTVLLLSVIALGIAIPISVAAGKALAAFLARFLNFDLQSYAIPVWVFGLELGIGLLVPILAAAYPVSKGSRVTVREAINDYGISERKFGAGIFDKMISNIDGLPRPLLFSLRNTFRRPGRLAVTLATLAAGGTIFIAAWNVRASFVHTIDLMFESMRFDIALNFAELYPTEKVEDILRNTPGIMKVESWASAEATPVSDNGSNAESFRIAGLPSSSNLLTLNIVEGRGLRRDDKNILVINNRLSKEQPALHVGKRVRLRIRDREDWWLIVGLAREAFAGPAAYGNYDSVARAGNQLNQTRNVRLVTTKHDRTSVDIVKRTLEQRVAKEKLQASSVTAMADRRRVIDEHNSVIYAVLIIMALLIVFVGGLGLMTVMSISVLERRREIGVLRSIGATRRALLAMLLTEGSFIAALSWLLSILPAVLISNVLGNFVANKMFQASLDSAFDPIGVVVWLLLTLVFGAAASLLPAWNASHLTVRQLVEYE